jgi:hypothetical protein
VGPAGEKGAQQAVRLIGDFLSSLEAGNNPGSDPATLALRWAQASTAVVSPGVQHGSALVRGAACSVVACCSPAAYSQLSRSAQVQLMQAACEAAAEDGESPVRAAACKGLAALCLAPEALLLPRGAQLIFAALRSACEDAVLAVRVQAGAALAATCATLAGMQAASAKACVAKVDGGARGLVRLAAALATGSDKAKASGVAALAALLGAPCLTGQLTASDMEEAGTAIENCLANQNAKVQWAACGAAGAFLAASASAGRPPAEQVLLALERLIREDASFKTRSLAAGALRGLGSLEACGRLHGRLVAAVAAGGGDVGAGGGGSTDVGNPRLLEEELQEALAHLKMFSR